MYAHKDFPKVRPDQIEYTVVCKNNVKKRSRSDKSGIGQTVEEEDCSKKGKSKKNKRPFQEQDDSFVPVPCMKEFRDDCLRGLHVISLSKPTKL
ncbi:hypothetical protein PVAP13_1NG183800 [Panicum virgatum]|uniref:Uncharacterized protein n=1 Tax=Panicum virgatum TaxID=38727 RepID=A0A8T0WLV6_PANVG|nr:hypothetical protein PVAP13_1NG183800 [Panicum virgatum]